VTRATEGGCQPRKRKGDGLGNGKRVQGLFVFFFFYARKLWSGQLAAGGGERLRKPKIEAEGLIWVSFWQRGSERRFG